MGKENCPCDYNSLSLNKILMCDDYDLGKPCGSADVLKKGAGKMAKLIDGKPGTSSKGSTRGNVASFGKRP